MFLFKLLYKHRKISWVLFLLTFSVLIYGIFIPQVRTGMGVPNLDKFLHFCGFFSVFLFGRFATHGWSRGAYWILPAVCALLLEYLQGQLVPSRDFSYLDMLANIIGVGAAGLLWLGLVKTGQLESE